MTARETQAYLKEKVAYTRNLPDYGQHEADIPCSTLAEYISESEERTKAFMAIALAFVEHEMLAGLADQLGVSLPTNGTIN